MAVQERFVVWDWIVFAVLLLVSVAIGIYYAVSGGKQKTTKEFLSGDRNMKVIPIAISILVSFQSAILIIGTPAEMYTVDSMFFINTFGSMLGCIITSVLFVPLFYNLKTVSVYEYVELRFKSRAARVISSSISILSTLIFTGFVSFAPATALESISGFPDWASYLIMGSICTIYTFLGGLKAVVWVDAFQGLIMLAGILAIIIQGLILVGGFGEVWHISEQWDRINFWNFNPDPTIRHTFWSLVVGGTITTTGIYGTTQSSIQRFTALPTLTDAKIAVMFNAFATTIFATLACFSGLVVFAYYVSVGCDPLTNRDIANPNQIIPYYVTDVLGYPGVPGLFISALYSGSLRIKYCRQTTCPLDFLIGLSILEDPTNTWVMLGFNTISSNLNALCAQTWEDILKPFLDHKSEKFKSWVTRIIVLIYGILGVGITFLVRNVSGTVLQAVISFSAAGGGPLTGIIVLGALFPWANWIGAIVGSIASYAIIMWLNIAQYSLIPPPNTNRFPTDNCTVESLNSSFISTTTSSLLANLTTTMAPTGHRELSALERYYSLSYQWYLTYGVLIVIVVGAIVSLITGPVKKKDLDPKYIIPVCDTLCCCLPASIRRKLQCGYDFSSAKYQEEDREGDRDLQEFSNISVINDKMKTKL